jgi:hypothetical protein
MQMRPRLPDPRRARLDVQSRYGWEGRGACTESVLGAVCLPHRAGQLGWGHLHHGRLERPKFLQFMRKVGLLRMQLRETCYNRCSFSLALLQVICGRPQSKRCRLESGDAVTQPVPSTNRCLSSSSDV